MPNFPGSDWLNAHWNQLPNNMWVVATSNGLIASNESIDPLISLVQQNFNFNQVTFAYVTFDSWQ